MIPRILVKVGRGHEPVEIQQLIDTDLRTRNKTVVGAINELEHRIDSMEESLPEPLIMSVDPKYFSLESKNLTLLDITMDKVVGLPEALNSKVNAVEGSRLITSIEVEKLEKLVLNEDGTIKGLSDNNFDDTLLAKLNSIASDAEANYIKLVSEEFTVSEEGELSVSAVNVDKLTQTEGAYLILDGGTSA